MKSILLIDNFDSFTFNLQHQVEKLSDARVDVLRNDVVRVESVLRYSGVIVSPGPGLPADAGKLMDVISRCMDQRIPLLGVCLGLQAVTQLLGGVLFNLEHPAHGVALPVHLTEPCILYNDVPVVFEAARYHSWGVKVSDLPDELVLTGIGISGEVMSFRHSQLPVYAVQYHPESILTPYGDTIIGNWLTVC